ncbi:type II toxin-antitoxin system HicB family antitoxin [Candidatus Roizmanbacteria bacterium CG10_big_fil_rev_8_21_14_0_10_39_12]|uniref:Type II toxin-antitoxin system HicB family antitoxin n=2 Tax=Candidatus Roizmaniibacteriota TaxID=1752723 RepID=A0A2M8KNF5_9BACT|nr:MAG: type II toxin-antitoxin system HicB family antitoxin [Candidatus Roizmanbacteria bacterium CG10_big_fil_rev_8_21_14_0_10_39_12]
MNKGKMLSYTVMYQKAQEGGFTAFVPALSGCHTQGETFEETESNVREAIELYIESITADNKEIPNESTVLQSTIQIQYPLAI